MFTYKGEGHRNKIVRKCECVSSVMTIAPVLNIERDKMGTLGIIMGIGDGFYVCNCTVYSYVSKQFTHHAFVYDIHFSTKREECMLWCNH